MDYSHQLPPFEYEYLAAETGTEHLTGYVTPMTYGIGSWPGEGDQLLGDWGDFDPMDTPFRSFLSRLASSQYVDMSEVGSGTSAGVFGDLSLEKRAFLVPTGLPRTLWESRKHGFLDVDERFPMSVQITTWFKDASTAGARYKNVLNFSDYEYASESIEDSDDRLAEYIDEETDLWLHRNGYGDFVDYYSNYYGMRPFKCYRTMLIYRAKYDSSDWYNSDVDTSIFEDDPVVGAWDHGGTTNSIYEVLYSAVNSALKYDTQVLSNSRSAHYKTFVNASEGTESLMPTHPATLMFVPGVVMPGTTAYYDIESGAYPTDTLRRTDLSDMYGEGDAYETQYKYLGDGLVENIKKRFKILEGDSFAVKETHEDFMGALTKQLAILVGVDNIPRGYATKMQATRPIRPRLLSAIAPARPNASAPTSAAASTAATTTATTMGEY